MLMKLLEMLRLNSIEHLWWEIAQLVLIILMVSGWGLKAYGLDWIMHLQTIFGVNVLVILKIEG